MNAPARKIPAPQPNPETQGFWEAAGRGTLMLGKCRSCGALHYYPRALCPFCFGETELQAASGTGTIYSFGIMRRAPVPYAIAYVTLAEGVTIMTNIVDCDFERIRIGQEVRLVFHASEGGPPVPMFAPA